MNNISLDLGLADRSIVVTGGAGLIGRVVVDHFLAAGSKVSSFDIVYPKDDLSQPDLARPTFRAIHCDVSSEASVQQAFAMATQAHGPVEICIALASLDLSVLEPTPFADASLSQLQRVLSVNVTGTWLTARAWFQGLRQAKQDGIALRHPNLIIIGSESGHFGERHAVDYSLGKSAVQGGLLMSLRAEAPRAWQGARVNVVAPGPVETDRWHEECKRDPSQLYLEAQATVMITPHNIPPLPGCTTPDFTLAQALHRVLDVTDGPRLRCVNQCPSKPSQWRSCLSQVTTSVAISMARLSTWTAENREKSCGPKKRWLKPKLDIGLSKVFSQAWPCVHTSTTGSARLSTSHAYRAGGVYT
jgi:NAD(P)-dependent dehydrogenase (short-subunit alcohol dehydrogenase family)